MTKEILCTGPVDDIDALIRQCNFPPDSFLLIERFPRYMVNDAKERENLLRFARLHDGIDIAPYTSGRIFHEDFELRWEKESNGNYRVVYIGKELQILGLEEDKNTLNKLNKRSEPKHYYLFGEHLDAKTREQMGIAQQMDLEQKEEYYAEVRISRLLRYPVHEVPEKRQRVQLSVYEYTDRETGRVKLFRFQNLRPAE